MIRALWLHHAADEDAVKRGDQYLWGRDILVSPVVEKGATSRRLYLPHGAWFDFWTEERIEGGRTIDRPVDLETMPLHVRAGAIVPFGPVKQYVDEAVADVLSITIYPGADGAFDLYEDDGRTFAYARGEWTRIEMRWDDRNRRFTIGRSAGGRLRSPRPSARPIELRLAGDQSIRRILFDGRQTRVEFGSRGR
jgi:alpha-glucosidase/alpha-D-xyloside xylohydrolase